MQMLKKNQELHDAVVTKILNWMTANGFNLITAHLPGKLKPPTLNGYIPDICAAQLTYNSYGQPIVSNVFVVEVETEESKGTLHSIFQRSALENWANKHNAEFELIVI